MDAEVEQNLMRDLKAPHERQERAVVGDGIFAAVGASRAVEDDECGGSPSPEEVVVAVVGEVVEQVRMQE